MGLFVEMLGRCAACIAVGGAQLEQALPADRQVGCVIGGDGIDGAVICAHETAVRVLFAADELAVLAVVPKECAIAGKLGHRALLP